MRITAFLLAIVLLCSMIACTQTPAEPADTPAESTSDTTAPAEDTADGKKDKDDKDDKDEKPANTTLDPFEVVSEDGTYKLVFGKGSVVIQGEPGDATWGHYNFPNIGFTKEGFLICSWSYSTDTIDYKPAPAGMITRRVSVNKGKSWMLPTSLDVANTRTEDKIMGNGKYFMGFGGHAAHKVSYHFDYTPYATWGEGFNAYNLYLREDLMKDDSEDAILDTAVFCNIYDPETNTSESIEIDLNWPYAPVTVHPGNKAYPLRMVFSLQSASNMVIDGIPYVFLYTHGFDSFAKTREEALGYKYANYYSTFVLNSPDYGKTWNLIAQLKTTDKIIAEAKEGLRANQFHSLCEPQVTVTPDGTMVMLMRTGNANPCYVSYSTDKGYTWTEPEIFDECGVLPQIITLDCGVTLATYGRPYQYVRSTNDPSGKEWDEHITIPLTIEPTVSNYMNVSCFNNDLKALDEDTAIIAYTDFRYPNKEGTKVKTVITRTIDVVFLDKE